MSEKKRFIDVWIVDISKVYREVPFNVVVDWIQQGRLLEDDRVRPSGTPDWVRLGDMAEFVPYLPRPEPHRAEDQAEALEPVALDFAPSRRRAEPEDDDVDMIPLIDVSLVLLIFFMMTAAGGAAPIHVPLPEVPIGNMVDDKDGIYVAITLEGEGKDAAPVYAMGIGQNGPEKDHFNLRTLPELLQRLDQRLARNENRVDLTINADEKLRSGVVRDLTTELSKRGRREKISQVSIGVTGVSK